MGAPDAREHATRFSEQTLVLLLADLGRFTQAVAHLSALEVAEVIDHFYALAAREVVRHGGEALKFSGDSCLATFAPGEGPGAVACALSLREGVRALGAEEDLALDLGVNIHRATVATGWFGEPPHAVRDVIGRGVVHLFKMGSGPGIRVSEPVYRALASGERSTWQKHQPPATYTLRS